MEELMGSLASFYSQLPVFWDCLLIQNTWAAAPAQLGSFNPLKHQLSCWDLPILRSGVNPRSHKTAGMLGLGALCRIAQCHVEVVCWCGALSCSFGVGRPKAASQHPHKSGVALTEHMSSHGAAHCLKTQLVQLDINLRLVQLSWFCPMQI